MILKRHRSGFPGSLTVTIQNRKMFGFLTGAVLIAVWALFSWSGSGPADCSASTVGAGHGEEEGLLVAISSTTFGGDDEEDQG
jgi:hypothetical protein